MASPVFIPPRLLEGPEDARVAYDRASDADKETIHAFLTSVDTILRATDTVQQAFVTLLGTMHSGDPEDLQVGTDVLSRALAELDEAKIDWPDAVEHMKRLPVEVKNPFTDFLGEVEEALRGVQVR